MSRTTHRPRRLRDATRHDTGWLEWQPPTRTASAHQREVARTVAQTLNLPSYVHAARLRRIEVARRYAVALPPPDWENPTESDRYRLLCAWWESVQTATQCTLGEAARAVGVVIAEKSRAKDAPASNVFDAPPSRGDSERAAQRRSKRKSVSPEARSEVLPTGSDGCQPKDADRR